MEAWLKDHEIYHRIQKDKKIVAKNYKKTWKLPFFVIWDGKR